jgi:S1-C subfamily serine protease
MIHDLFLIVTLLLQVQSGQPIGTATGFFYTRAEQLYLVTNRHVVRDDQRKLRPEALRVTVHADPRDVRNVVTMDVPLYQGGKQRWHVHRDYSTHRIDIAVIQLDQQQFRKYPAIRSLSKKNFLAADAVISPGENLMVVGYPRALRDTVHHLPIVRNATASSAYGIPFNGAPLFLVDASLHPGMSGSPVLTKPREGIAPAGRELDGLSERGIFFLGVHSAGVDVNVGGTNEPLGLGTVWYARLLEEILDGFGAP